LAEENRRYRFVITTKEAGKVKENILKWFIVAFLSFSVMVFQAN